MALTDNAVIALFVTMPIVAVLVAVGLLVLIVYAMPYLTQLKTSPSPPKMFYWMGGVGIVTPIVLAGLLCAACYTIHPIEAFQDVSGAVSVDNPTLLTDLAAAEDATCKLITRVDGFIQNDLGPSGQADSQLILAAQMKARDGVAMVDCSATEAALEDVPHRLTRLEETLRSFTAPELQRTYDTTMRCEGFVGAPPTNRERLTAIQATIRDQQTRLLAPVDQKTEDLQRGIASDCDKRRAAAHMTPPPDKK